MNCLLPLLTHLLHERERNCERMGREREAGGGGADVRAADRASLPGNQEGSSEQPSHVGKGIKILK